MFVNGIYRHARENPGRLAIVNSGEEITYRRFAQAIEAARNYLMKAGLPKGGIVVNITSNLYRDWVLLLAVRSLGLTTVSGSSWQVLDGLNLRGIVGMVCYAEHTDAIEAFSNAMPGCLVVELPHSILEAADQNNGEPAPVDGQFGDHIVYTSGTTGTYKKLLYSGPEIESAVEIDRFGLVGRYATAKDVIFCHSFGPWTAAGYKNSLRSWYRGATVIFDQRADWADHFFDYPVTLTTFMSGWLNQVCENLKSRPHNFPKLRVQVGGGFLDAGTARKLIEQLDCDIFVAYGGTEFRTPFGHFMTDDDDVVWLTQQFDEVEIVDDDHQPVPTGVEGQIRIGLAPYDPKGYIDDEEATLRHYRDGWFYPGDMAVRRDDGRVRILGRVDDVLNLAGNKIAIQPFENAASQLLGVRSLCAFSQQDDQGNDLLLVVIEGEELPAKAKLEALASKIPQVPKVRYSLIRKFPRGTNGMMKVNRRKVLELVRASWTN